MKRSLLIGLGLILLVIVITIPPVAANPTITGVSPSSAPNSGTFTLTITGTDLMTANLVRLNKCKLKTGGSSEAPFSGTIVSAGPTKIVAKFDLSGKKVGQYDISALVPTELSSENWAVGDGIFQIYDSSGSAPTTTTTTDSSGTVTTTATTSEESGDGDNSVFFDTSPGGATVYLDGDEIGTTPFTFHTDKDGNHEVTVKKSGYEEYSETISIVRNQRVYFFTSLTQILNFSDNTPANGSSVKPGQTTIVRNTLRIPTPLGTFETPVEESPVSPATALWAIAAGAVLIVLRRR
jgi:hypothetical protein